jgi:hypothetical protein
MRALHAISLIAIFTLVGCDRITGAADQKILDAKAIGYACRVSLKTPEDCMKENDTYSPADVLSGWKDADKDINGKLLDPNMGKAPPPAPAAAPSAPATNPVSASATTDKSGKPAPAKKAKP